MDPIEVVSVTTAAHGTATVFNGHVRFTPNLNFHGQDEFDYTIRDDEGLTDTATVRIEVNTPPTADDLNLFRPHGTTGNVVVVASASLGTGLLAGGFDADGDPLTAELVNPPTHGTVTVNPNGSFEYVPTTPGGLLYSDTFEFALFDGVQYSNVARVNISVPNDPPVADDLLLEVEHGLEGRGFGQFPARDADGDPLTFELVADPERGTITLLPDGRFAYEPAGDEYIDWSTGLPHIVDRVFRGPNEFTFRVADSYGVRSNVAKVRIHVRNHARATNLGSSVSCVRRQSM